MDIAPISVEIPEGCNIILGQTHFIKTAEDLYEIMASSVPDARFGIAFSEASGPCLVRTEGNDEALIQRCVRTLLSIGAGHVFCIILKNAFPLAVLDRIKACPEVCRVFCATANPLQVIVATTAQGSGVLGVIDGSSPRGVEGGEDRARRREFLRKIGYKP